MLPADGPDGLNSINAGAVIRPAQTRRNIRTHPVQPPTELHPTLRALVNATLEELTDQHATAKPCCTHGLTENAGEAAAVGGGMHLQLALRCHQIQGVIVRTGSERGDRRPIQLLEIGSSEAGSFETMAIGEACGHHDGIDAGGSRRMLNLAVKCEFTRESTLSVVCRRCDAAVACEAGEASSAPMSASLQSRRDGRTAETLRPFSVRWDPMGFALSSLIVHTGRTAVLCSVCLEDNVPRWRKGEGLGWLSAEYRLLPGSTPQRQGRELMKLSGRTQEIQRLIGRSLRGVVDMGRLGERSLLIDCDVIQADAGTRTAAITGAWLALKCACDRLMEKGVITQTPLLQQVAAVSVGLVGGQPLLDLDYSEDSVAEVDLNVVQAGDGRLLEIQGTAEGAPFSREQLDVLLDLAQPGLETLMAAQRQVLGDDKGNG